MLKGKLLHPEILSVLGRCGHGARILIADGNFPFESKTNPAAARVFLNLAPGLVGCTDVLSALCSVITVESALVMSPPACGDYAVSRPGIWDRFQEILTDASNGCSLTSVGRFTFYDCCRSDDVTLVIATGEQRIFANLLLTIGVVSPEV